MERKKRVGLVMIGLIFCALWFPLFAAEEEDEEEEEEEISIPMEEILSFEKHAPAFMVKLRKEEELDAFPCMDCHEDEEPNPTERELEEDHEDLVLEHGGGRFWCITCHHLEQRDYLTSLKNKRIDFDQSYRLCGQCHFQRQKDWFFGGHGKRVGNWKGDRELYLCTECHNPHSPAIEPIPPNPPPKVRKGLEYVPTKHHKHVNVWEKYLPNQNKEEDHGH